MDKLRILTGSLQGAVVELIGEEITVGRSPDNAVCLDDESVSEHHATLTRRGQDWTVQDAGSATGTVVRGKKVRTAKLENGDMLSFGRIELHFEGAEKKLSLPSGQTVMPAPSSDTSWPLHQGARMPTRRIAFASAIYNVVQLLVFAAVAYGGYWMYQRLSSMGPEAESPSPSAARADLRALPPPAPAASVPVSAPVPDANPPAQTVAVQTTPAASTAVPVQPAPPATPATKPCVTCNRTGSISCRWCKEGQVDCPGPCLKLSRGVWQHMDVAGHDPKELWQKFYNKHGGYMAWSQGHVGQIIEMQNGEPVNMGPCKICNGTAHVACSHCQGTGKFVCPTCRGIGSVPLPQPYALPARR